MAGKIARFSEPGLNAYVIMRRPSDGAVRDVVNGAWDSYNASDFDDYDITVTESGTDSGFYRSTDDTFLSGISAGKYNFELRERAGASPDPTDLRLAQWSDWWDGTTFGENLTAWTGADLGTNAATLKLKKLECINSSGVAFQARTTANNTDAVSFECASGTGTVLALGADTGRGLYAYSSGSSRPAVEFINEGDGDAFVLAVGGTGKQINAPDYFSLSVPADGDVTTWTFANAVTMLARRFFGKSTLTATELKTFADNGSVITTQAVSDTGTVQTVDAAE